MEKNKSYTIISSDLNEIIVLEKRVYKFVESPMDEAASCAGCELKHTNACRLAPCSFMRRDDNKSGVFKKTNN